MAACVAYVRLVESIRSRQWVIDHCPFCGKRHVHGAGLPGDDPRRFLGERCAHCVSPETRTYVLKEI